MDIHFSIDGNIDPISLYAAILSTLIGCWEFIKWRNRNAIALHCNPNMLFIPSTDNQKYVVATVTNLGDKPTTITHFMGYFWKNGWDKFFNKNRQAFVVNSPNVPKVVQPGEQWMGQALQDEEIEAMASKGLLYMGIKHSLRRKEILQRVEIKPAKPK